MKIKEEIRCSLFRTLNTTQPPIAVTLGEVHHPIHFPGLYAQVKHHISHFEAPCQEEELILNFYRKPKPGEQGGLERRDTVAHQCRVEASAESDQDWHHHEEIRLRESTFRE